MGDITEYPRVYEEKIRKLQSKIPEPTYEQVHEFCGLVDFDWKGYFDKFDWDNIPNGAEYQSSLKLIQETNKSREVYIRPLQDELSDCIVDLCENQLGMTAYETALMYQPKGSLSLNHIDIHGNFRMRNGLMDKISDDDILIKRKVKRYWLPCSDRKHGQYFEVNGVQILWKAGELYKFPGNAPHCGGTLAEEARIFIIITGTDIPLGDL
jgi:hypothetical protein